MRISSGKSHRRKTPLPGSICESFPIPKRNWGSRRVPAQNLFSRRLKRYFHAVNPAILAMVKARNNEFLPIIHNVNRFLRDALADSRHAKGRFLLKAAPFRI